MRFTLRIFTAFSGIIALARGTNETPPPPSPEPIMVTELPLPPAISSDEPGSCTLDINPHGTGCIGQTAELRSGSFLPDGNHIVASVNFTGAPSSESDTRSYYSGVQLIIIRTNGTTFSNGDPWKCITCGIPAEQTANSTTILEYPQAFYDGKRVLVGNNIVESTELLSSSANTPNNTYIYPVRFNNKADGSGPGGSIRELRIHPDNVHLGFNAYTLTDGEISEFGYFGRLEFNPSPSTGAPLSPRYDTVNVTLLFDLTAPQPVEVNGDSLIINSNAISIGELRGFTGTGQEITYVGHPAESSNIDLFAVSLSSGQVRRITEHPGYADPIDVSHDDQWSVILDTRSNNRTMFIAGMRHIPPITDLVSTGATSSVRNNGNRRFFEPWLLDYTGDRGTYFGQQINVAGDGSPSSINDPQWNAQADPRWSLDGTKISYYQALTASPACGGVNPLPCPNSTEQGGRTYRIMLAELTSRTAVPFTPVAPVSDVIPWGTPYVPGSTAPARPFPRGGNYTLHGNVSGAAHVTLIENSGNTGLQTAAVTYHNFSDDGLNQLNGYENVTSTSLSETLLQVDWYSDLVSVGKTLSTKKTSPTGFHLWIDLLETVFNSTGSLTTTIDGVVYVQPANYT